MALPADDLRDRIDGHLDAFDSLEELSDARYHVTHERFESASNQRAMILDWLEDLADRMAFPSDRATRMLSVGCVTWHSAAACPKCRCVATATRYVS